MCDATASGYCGGTTFGHFENRTELREKMSLSTFIPPETDPSPIKDSATASTYDSMTDCMIMGKGSAVDHIHDESCCSNSADCDGKAMFHRTLCSKDASERGKDKAAPNPDNKHTNIKGASDEACCVSSDHHTR